jgi:hypothetical protein
VVKYIYDAIVESSIEREYKKEDNLYGADQCHDPWTPHLTGLSMYGH